MRTSLSRVLLNSGLSHPNFIHLLPFSSCNIINISNTPFPIHVSEIARKQIEAQQLSIFEAYKTEDYGKAASVFTQNATFLGQDDEDRQGRQGRFFVY